jgi:predicted transport protein
MIVLVEIVVDTGALLGHAILDISDDIMVKPTKYYVGFIAKRNVCDINVQHNALKTWINVKRGELENSKFGRGCFKQGKMGKWGL